MTTAGARQGPTGNTPLPDDRPILQEDNTLYPFTTAQRDLLPDPAANQIIFNADENELQAWIGGAWVTVAPPDCLVGAFVAAHEHEASEHTHSEYAEDEHPHPEYADFDHPHPEYAAPVHQHPQYANFDHPHPEYVAPVHQHPEYAVFEHPHPEYADFEHPHPGYAAPVHQHPEYADFDHPHPEYAASVHPHPQYAEDGHSHIEYVKAWGYVTAEGNLAGSYHGARVSRTGANANGYRYRVTLAASLSSPCIPIVTADVDRIRFLSKTASGFEIQMERGTESGTDRPFHFVVH